MSMSNYANYADVIQNKDIEKIVPKEWKDFMDTLAKNDMDFEDFAREHHFEDCENKAVVESYQKLQNAFNKKTYLKIRIQYHDAEESDRGDDINGAFFAVDGMYQLTPAGKKYKDIVVRKFYVTFG